MNVEQMFYKGNMGFFHKAEKILRVFIKILALKKETIEK